MKERFSCLLLLLWLLPVLPCASVAVDENADTDLAAEDLARQLAPLNNFTAQFQQTLYSADDYPLQKTDGEMEVARPGKMRWISNPPMEQWVLANGETLWVYDPDLEQVTIKPFLEDIHDTPAMLFIGGLERIGNDYAVAQQRTGGDDITYVLTPKAENSLYSKVALSFHGSLPSAIVLWDRMGQRTNVVLTRVKSNRTIDPGRFEFVVPEGTDIFRDE